MPGLCQHQRAPVTPSANLASTLEEKLTCGMPQVFRYVPRLLDDSIVIGFLGRGMSRVFCFSRARFQVFWGG